jgi:hypothetical protein
MDLKLNFVGLISVLASEWTSLLQFIIDILLENSWDLLKIKRIYFTQKRKTLSHRAKVWPKLIMAKRHAIKTIKYVDIRRKRVH